MTQKRSWPDKALVGYVAAYGSTIPPNVTNSMIDAALRHQYTVFVYSFGYINQDYSVQLPSAMNTPESDLQTQLQAIHERDGLALISFGGQNNTFDPGPDAQAAAKATVAFCQQYGFDGVDLDLEEITVDTEYLESYINEMRKLDGDLLLTAAPQIAGGYGGPASFAPANIFTTAFLVAANFDALLVQEYNQFGGAVFDGKQDTDVGFITASFGPMTEIVPPSTKIVVGEPANAAAGSGLSNPQDVVVDLESGTVLSNAQYGGIMVWAVNYDAEQNWSFADGVASVALGAITS